MARLSKTGTAPLFVLGALLLSACAGALPTGTAEVGPSEIVTPEAVETGVSSSMGFDVDFSFLKGAFETEDLHWIGAVEGIGDTQWTISRIVLSVDAFSKIDAGLALQDLAEVQAEFLPDGRLYAREIHGVSAASAPLEGSEIEFVGLVESIGGTSWRVAGIEVTVTPETEIKGALAVGDLAKVHALAAQNGKLTAREIEPAETELGDNEFVDEVEFTGIVDSIASDAWTISGRTVLISDRTEIKGTLTVGDYVKVHGQYNSGDKFVAREIELEENEDHQDFEGEMDFSGAVQAISATSVMIDGKTFALTPQTEVKGTIAPGDVVKVHVFVAADGTLTVRELELHDEAMDDDASDDDDEDDDQSDDRGEDDSSDDNSGGGDDDSGDDNS